MATFKCCRILNPMASKRTPPTKPERPQHSAQEKLRDIDALERRIKDLNAFDPGSINKRFTDHRVEVLQTAIDETLSEVFGNGTDDYQRYVAAARLDSGPVHMVTDWAPNSNEIGEARQYAAEGKERSISLLNRAVARLKEEIDREEVRSALLSLKDAATKKEAAAAEPSRKIFIVHGHDHEMKNDVARVVQLLGFEPVILHEQPNKGRTLIEKFEDHSETAGFAIVLLSPDDEGRVKGGEPWESRARQNVVLELGYFVGKAGRNRVCALMRGGVEVPSDIVGVVFEQYDGGGAWKLTLARELKAAGYTVDMNRLLG